MKASPWSFRGRQVQLWKKARSLIGKLSFMVGAAMVFGSYLYNTHLQWSVATTSQGSLSYFTATTDFVESYFGTCPGRINSYRWLVGARFGNIHTELNDNVIEQMSLFYTATTSDDLLASLLGQSLCYPQSQFRNLTVPSLPLAVDETTGSNADNNIDRLIRQWAVKLIYLSLYYHQHRHAIPEAEQRYRNAQPEQNGNSCLSQSQLTTDYGVGRYDYECPGAKYLVLPLGGNGLGANVRGGMVPAMLMGLMANRVVLFMNNLPTSVNADPDYINKEWPLASCSRKDHQCFFWPVSPCVLTEDDMISHTYYLNVSESRKLLNRREIPSYVDHYKVWVFQSAWTPISNFHPESAQKLYEIAQELIQSTNLFSGYDSELLSAAVESILIDDGERDVYNYAAATMKVQHTTTIYTLRPNPQVAQKLDSILADIMPPNFNPEYSIGLPVRASDKCDRESECLSFSQHMTITGEMWEKHLNRTTEWTSAMNPQQHDQLQWEPAVIFTTEATSMIEEQKVYVNESRIDARYPQYHFQYMTNHHDVTPDSGFIRNVDVSTNDADTIMISALSSLKAQLLPRLSIGNCCSNFHILLNDFLFEGCGAASFNTFHCIQETEDPLLKVCCGWHRDCQERKKELLLQMNATNITTSESGQD